MITNFPKNALFGASLLAIVVFNKVFFSPVTTDIVLIQSMDRADLLAIMGASFLLLDGFTNVQVDIKTSEPVRPINCKIVEDVDVGSDVAWLFQGLLQGTPACSVILLSKTDDSNWLPTTAKGVVCASYPPTGTSRIKKTPILDETYENSVEVSLQQLQNLPGRIEFEQFLPENMQAVLMVPDPATSTILLLGSDTAKSFTQRDIAWVKSIWLGVGI
ncbi:hypothetical protein ScalyP_jg4816 [Parmales sp. scaly parma]|nr:hypothetical protein ScalyP_jg4816 [Parmales sp. scaly parma]